MRYKISIVLKKALRFSSATAILALFAVGFLFRCANPSSPSGGPIDSLPPKIVSMVPELFTTNFASKKITIVFDEYIQLKNSQTQILFSPSINPKPTVVAKGKSVVIELEEPLDSSTTYKIDFGEAIVDNNEGNILRNFSYVFSTGEHIDSLAMSGQVIDGFTGDSIINATILLFDAAQDTSLVDSVIFRSNPASVARTDSMGIYLATNLKDINYKVYALVEEVSNIKYEAGADKIGFVDSAINPTTLPPFSVWFNPSRKKIEATPQVSMKVFQETSPIKRQSLLKGHRPKKNQVTFEFLSQYPKIDTLKIDSIAEENIIYNYSKFRDTISLFFNSIETPLPDSIRGVISYWSTTPDSLAKDTLYSNNFVYGFRDIELKLKKGEKAPNNFSFKSNAAKLFNPHDSISFTFSYPLLSIDSSQIVFKKQAQKKEEQQRGARGARGATTPKAQQQNESEEKADDFTAETFTLKRDTLDSLTWHFNAPWQDFTTYKLLIVDSLITNIVGEKNDSIDVTFTTMNPSEYGLININFENRDTTKNYVVSLTSKDGKNDLMTKREVNSNQLSFDFVEPSQYRIRIIEDLNKNGKWDVGDLVNRRQSELIAIYKDKDGGQVLDVKKNWELEIDIDLESLFEGEKMGEKSITSPSDSTSVLVSDSTSLSGVETEKETPKEYEDEQI